MDTKFIMICIPMDIISAFFLAITLAFAMGILGKAITHKRQSDGYSAQHHVSSTRTRHTNYSVMVEPTDLFDEEISRKRKESKKNNT